MEHNPYAGDGDAGIYTEPERTSIAAVLSLISSLICCLPAVPLLGIVLGALALIGIGRSNGRVGGRGLAVAGIVLGILFTVAQIGIGIGVKFGFDEWIKMHGPVARVFADLDSDQFDSARTALGGDLASVGDADMAAFRDAYTAEVGSFVSSPQSMGELFGVWGQVGPQFQAVQMRQNYMPIFLNFDSGPVLAAIEFDPYQKATGQGPLGELYIVDLWVVTPGGDVIELSDFVTEAPAGVPAATPEPETEEAPGEDAGGP